MPSNATLKARLWCALILGAMALLALAAHSGRAQTTDCAPRPELINLAQAYHDANAARPNYDEHWLRVLKAFGASSANVAAFTSDDAAAEELIWSGWKPFRQELERMEHCEAQAGPQQQSQQSQQSQQGLHEQYRQATLAYEASRQEEMRQTESAPEIAGFAFVANRSRSWVDILQYRGDSGQEMLLMRRPDDTLWTRTTCLGDLAAFYSGQHDYHALGCYLWADNAADDNYTPSGARCRYMPAGAAYRILFRFAGEILWLGVACP